MEPNKSVPRLLIVEDEGLVAMSIERHLTNLGYEVCCSVSTGADAVKQSVASRPDVVLMDIRLEGPMDGIEAAERIRAIMDIPIVYLTSYSDEKTLKRAKLTEPFGYVMKPFDEDMLRVTVEMALYKSQMQRRLSQAKERLETILRSLVEGVIVADETGAITFANPVARDLLGLAQSGTSANLPLRDLYRVFDEETREQIELPIARVIEQGEPSHMTDVQLAVADDRRVPIECSFTPLGDRQASEGVVVTFRDVTASKKAMKFVEGEQQRANDLHQSLLPEDGTTIGRIEMRRFFYPATTAGGDIFNFFPVDNTHAVLYLVDVVGHGVSAAGVSILLHRLLSPDANARHRYPVLDVDARQPVEVVQRLNRLFFLASHDLFFTILYAVIDTATGEVRFTRAGHPYPIRQRTDGIVEDVQSEGAAVGITERMSLAELRVDLKQGERLYLYTDGLTDCINRQLEHYSRERLIHLLSHSNGKDLHEAVSALETDFAQWKDPDAANDDTSLVAIQYR